MALPGGPTTAADVAQAFGRNPNAWIPANGAKGVTTMMNNWGQSARGIVFGTRAGGDLGHFFNVVNQNGAIRFLDGQVGGSASLSGYEAFYLLRTF